MSQNVMGVQEKSSRARTRRLKIQKVVLQSVAVAGVLSVALLAPNALQILKLFGVSKKRNFTQAINTSRRRLVAAGLLRYEDGFLRITEKGERKLREIERRNYQLPQPKRWDKKWRVLIFDIPERRKSVRDKVRLTLTAIGFKRLQNSVWVYPYDCEDLITLLKADFKIGRDLLYLIVDSIENDAILRDWFDI
ncbi:MAG: CRISPR-associated endonuclease Cas2 [Candidatus Lloydbacteria bacterium RIFCSPHIGHO2_02_FULL_50_13]|uniref:CRISPR-associated endonuclease Cas2 n=1 Tax=Candidatus Lloydbacteria bacterium RIFCSPHIGHO2_02_FULL_50_13 TaxID=1798661 RepID=A0A1G2DC33_9BACT|nr:MAG: CRISPR-associated endonuclease Cas2 [Candidatus Lloydbacteria bacterium RIFCSPHIGHO2_02_FULL_50_13]